MESESSSSPRARPRRASSLRSSGKPSTLLYWKLAEPSTAAVVADSSSTGSIAVLG
jgi:hypothetical protein